MDTASIRVPTSYEDDIYAWAFEQADVLRRLAATRPGLSNELDVENLSEEIEGVARHELRAAEGFLQLIFLHLLKLASAPDARPVEHWRAECETFQIDFADVLTRSMWVKVRIDLRWRQAVLRAKVGLEKEGDALLPGLPAGTCPLNLEILTAQPFDLDAALARIRASAAAPAQPSP